MFGAVGEGRGMGHPAGLYADKLLLRALMVRMGQPQKHALVHTHTHTHTTFLW